LSGGFLFIFARNLEEIEEWKQNSRFYSAKGIGNPLGDNGRIHRLCDHQLCLRITERFMPRSNLFKVVIKVFSATFDFDRFSLNVEYIIMPQVKPFIVFTDLIIIYLANHQWAQQISLQAP
jgi:hypothetical protein